MSLYDIAMTLLIAAEFIAAFLFVAWYLDGFKRK